MLIFQKEMLGSERMQIRGRIKVMKRSRDERNKERGDNTRDMDEGTLFKPEDEVEERRNILNILPANDIWKTRI